MKHTTRLLRLWFGRSQAIDSNEPPDWNWHKISVALAGAQVLIGLAALLTAWALAK